MTHLEDKLLLFESKNLLWSSSSGHQNDHYVIWNSAEFPADFRGGFCKHISASKKEGEKPHTSAGVVILKHVKNASKNLTVRTLFWKKTRSWSFCSGKMTALHYQNSFFALQPLVMNCTEVQTLNLKWIFLKGQVHSTYLYGIWSSRKLKLLMILRKEGSIPEWMSWSVNSPRDWQDLPIYTLACELQAAKPARQDVRARLSSETNKNNIQSTCSLQLSAFTH